MSGLIIGALVVGAIWLFVSMNSNVKAHQAFNAIDAAEPWLINNDIIPNSVKFSSYRDEALSEIAGATILAAIGENTNGERVGFVLEVTQAQGVLRSAYIEPYGIITHHRRAAQEAKIRGASLVSILQTMASQHRAQFQDR